MSLNRTSGTDVSIRFKTDINPAEEYEGLRSDESFTYKGKLYEQEDGFFVRYEDSGAKASIKQKGNTIVVTNAGNAGNRMFFEEGQDTQVLYQTAAGPMELTVKTKKAQVLRTTEKITLKLDYKIYMNGRVLSQYKPVIEIVF